MTTKCHAQPVGGFSRRGFLLTATVLGLTAFVRPTFVQAAEGNYEAMVLPCIDPRFVEPVRGFTATNGLAGKYSQFVIAGAVAPAFKDWHKAFWDNLATSVELHHITKVIAIDHRDCGAAKIAYGEARVATPDVETQTHRAARWPSSASRSPRASPGWRCKQA